MLKPVASLVVRLLDLGSDSPGLALVDRKHIRLTNLLALVSLANIPIWAPLLLAADRADLALQYSLAFGAGALVLLLDFAGRSLAAAVVLIVASQFLLLRSVGVFGFDSGVPFYYGALIVLSFAVLPRHHRRWAYLLAAGSLAEAVAVLVLGDRLPISVPLLEPAQLRLLNGAAAFGTLALLTAVIFSVVDATEDALSEERQRADRLLFNVLPASVAQRLKDAPEEALADRFEEVTILFADLVGFTELSARVTPSEIVTLLNELFTVFDAICDEHGAEKIKTIGDGYMAACGAPVEREDHALVMARAAMAMRAAVQDYGGDEQLGVRIGLNSGPVVGGIVGQSRVHYDLWGDAVNVAARMESHGEPGRIQLTRATWERIRHQIPCERRGEIEVKGRGTIEAFWIS